MSTMVLVVKVTPLVRVISSQTRAGVRNTPRMFEADAETTAPATLPLAIEVNAIEDCTVEGTRDRYSRPACRPGFSQPVVAATMPRPSSGKTR